MFGLSFGELVVLVIVAVVVIGPRDLPKILRKLGQWSGKLRRMASEMRAQSGIDDVLKADGLGEDIAEIRKLARGELDNVVASATIAGMGGGMAGLRGLGALDSLTSARGEGTSSTAAGSSEYAHGVAPLDYTSPSSDSAYDEVDLAIARDREYPREGADSYNALPDTAIVYDEGLPASEVATDSLYVSGEVSGEP
jgi:sec-independent protein translocase protein TatB